MKTLPIGADKKDIIRLLIEWTELLAQEKYSDAFHMFQAYSHEWEWTPELLEAAVFTYGVPMYATREEAKKELGYSDCKVTSLLENPDKDTILEHIDIHFYDFPVTQEIAKSWDVAEIDYENIIGDVHYFDVPIDGKMSDLTAIFYIKKIDPQHITLSFKDLHMM